MKISLINQDISVIKPPYRLYFNFKNKSYVVEVYNEKYLSIYPWDGNYPRDYINMDSLPSFI